MHPLATRSPSANARNTRDSFASHGNSSWSSLSDQNNVAETNIHYENIWSVHIYDIINESEDQLQERARIEAVEDNTLILPGVCTLLLKRADSSAQLRLLNPQYIEVRVATASQFIAILRNDCHVISVFHRLAISLYDALSKQHLATLMFRRKRSKLSVLSFREALILDNKTLLAPTLGAKSVQQPPVLTKLPSILLEEIYRVLVFHGDLIDPDEEHKENTGLSASTDNANILARSPMPIISSGAAPTGFELFSICVARSVYQRMEEWLTVLTGSNSDPTDLNHTVVNSIIRKNHPTHSLIYNLRDAGIRTWWRCLTPCQKGMWEVRSKLLQ